MLGPTAPWALNKAELARITRHQAREANGGLACFAAMVFVGSITGCILLAWFSAGILVVGNVTTSGPLLTGEAAAPITNALREDLSALFGSSEVRLVLEGRGFSVEARFSERAAAVQAIASVHRAALPRVTRALGFTPTIAIRRIPFQMIALLHAATDPCATNLFGGLHVSTTKVGNHLVDRRVAPPGTIDALSLAGLPCVIDIQEDPTTALEVTFSSPQLIPFTVASNLWVADSRSVFQSPVVVVERSFQRKSLIVVLPLFNIEDEETLEHVLNGSRPFPVMRRLIHEIEGETLRVEEGASVRFHIVWLSAAVGMLGAFGVVVIDVVGRKTTSMCCPASCWFQLFRKPLGWNTAFLAAVAASMVCVGISKWPTPTGETLVSFGTAVATSLLALWCSFPVKEWIAKENAKKEEAHQISPGGGGWVVAPPLDGLVV